jgi:predicted AlkP superfamily pyrophosphatase or phosphodiesterase
MSPNNLLCNTVGDQLKLNDSLSKVFGVSIKDRGAILSTGTLADGAYWLNNNAQWITSSYYLDSLPKWVAKFENESPAISYMDKNWSGTHFDYNLKKMVDEKGISAIKATPRGNDFTFDFAKKIIENESVGKDIHTDLMVISFSSTDYVGHKFGPDAEEVKSTYVALDKTIGRLFDFLDDQVGENKYLIMLTSDHGAGTSPSVITEKKLKGGNFNSTKVKNRLDSVLTSSFGIEGIVARYANMQFYINYDLIDSLKLKYKDIYKTVKETLISEPSVKEVLNIQELKNSYPTNENTMLLNGFHYERSGDIFLLLNPGFIEWSRKTGTSHGTHYNYDTHVPLFFYGPNVNPEHIYSKSYICDIAPTLSILMNIGFPNAAEGSPIVDVFK